ncbi:MAG: hypothetical protein KC492_38605, partial [Myxococcales bacterium]|nr:hypothetical protein [Myxococcales bacterium]
MFNDIRCMAFLLFTQDNTADLETVIQLTLELNDSMKKEKERAAALLQQSSASAGDGSEAEEPVLGRDYFREPYTNPELHRGLLPALCGDPNASYTVRGTLSRLEKLLVVYDAMLHLMRHAYPQPSQINGLLTAYMRLEKPQLMVIAKMKYAGCAIDTSMCMQYYRDMYKERERLRAEIESHIPADCALFHGSKAKFNAMSHNDISKLLYDVLKLDQHINQNELTNANNNQYFLPQRHRTAGGKKSTKAEVLEKIKPFHPLPAVIIKFRKINKLMGTYFAGTLRCSRPIDGWIQRDIFSEHFLRSGGTVADEGTARAAVKRDLESGALSGRKIRVIHASFLADQAVSGRWSCAEPNLQNLPRIRDADPTGFSNTVRKMFVPLRPDHILVAFDFEQIELRVLANCSHCAELIRTLNDPDERRRDIHRRIAASIFDKSFDDVTGDERSSAKACVFGTLYG